MHLQSAMYGTLYITADQIQPRHRRMDDGGIVVHLVDIPGVSLAVVGTSDAIIAACTRVATDAADSEEPRFEFADMPAPTLRDLIVEPEPGVEHGPTEQTTVTVTHRFPPESEWSQGFIDSWRPPEDAAQ